MTHWSAYFIGAAVAAAPISFVHGGALFACQKRRRGLLHWAFGMLSLIFGLAAIPAMAVLLARTDHIEDPTRQGRRVAEVAINLAYDSFWIALLGIPAAVLVGVHTYRKHASRTRPSSAPGE